MAARMPKTARGFSLMELIVVITIIGILGVSAMAFFRPALESYFDARRRADMSDMADSALRRMGREVRAAVPNSVQTYGNTCFRLVRTVGGGRYRKYEDMTRVDSQALDLAQTPPHGFDVLSPLQAAVGDWVVIGNQTGSDVYAGHNRAAITANGAVDAALGTARLAMAAMNGTDAPFSYTDGRFVVTPKVNPVVTYVCDGAGLGATGTGMGTLRRVAGDFGGGDAVLSACPAGGDLVARHVSACRFLYNPSAGATQQSGFVWMELELAEANEKVRLAYGAHIVNLP
jgi:MSHA biogenesis protein MshO